MNIRNKAWKMILEQQLEMRNDHEAESNPKEQRNLDDSINDRTDSDDEMANMQTATKSTESLSRPLTKSFVIRQTTILNRKYSE